MKKNLEIGKYLFFFNFFQLTIRQRWWPPGFLRLLWLWRGRRPKNFDKDRVGHKAASGGALVGGHEWFLCSGGRSGGLVYWREETSGFSLRLERILLCDD